MKIHQYNEMMRWLTRPKEDPSLKQQVAGLSDMFPQTERPFTGKVGGLVEPGVTHYAKKEKFDTLGRPIRYTAKPLTKNQINMMRKNKPEGVHLLPDGHIKGQWNYGISLTKGKKGDKHYRRVTKELRATPENLDKLVDLREKTWKEFYPNRLTTKEFKRLRLEEWSELSDKAFAEKLNKLGYRTQTNNWTGKFNLMTVRNRQEFLGISKDVGRNIEKRKMSEVKNIIRNSSGGTDFLQVYSGNEKVLRTRANQLVLLENLSKSQGWFPSGTSNEAKLWNSFFRARKGDRINIVGEFADGNFPRDVEGHVDWFKKNIVIVPVVAAIIAGTFTSVRYVLNLTDTITANSETILKLGEKYTASVTDIYDLKTRLAAAEATWTMAENLYRQLSETVRDHEYDLKALSR